MNGIYSSLPPTHEMPREPINAMRARDGLRPLCWNRPDFPSRVQVMGKPVAVKIEDGRWIAAPTVEFVDNSMSKECNSWSVHPQEDPATESIPGRESWLCWGCRHLPQDPRVIARAKQAEEA